MKNHLLFCFFLFGLLVNAQDFSGSITFEFSYDVFDGKTLDEIGIEQPTDSIVYTVTNGYYKSKEYANGEVIESYSYSPDTKLMYFLIEERDYYLFMDTQKKSTLPPPLFEVDKTIVDTILDYPVYKNSITDASGVENTNYYAEEISVEPKSFKTHNFAHWNYLLHKFDGAIAIKSVAEYDDYILTKKAVNIKEIDLDSSDFKIDLDKEIIASYDTLDEQVEFVDPDEKSLYCYMAKVEEAERKLIYGKQYQFYVRLVVDKNGDIKHVKAENKDSLGLYKIAEDIVKNCDLKFKPGKIAGRKISSETFFPVDF
ncbi:MAG: energy transducer TonB [Bacteroidota bacterium]